MTGGGFGGSTVSLVRRDLLESFRQEVTDGYERRTGLKTNIYVSEAGDGAREVISDE
jgi:galactokinase